MPGPQNTVVNKTVSPIKASWFSNKVKCVIAWLGYIPGSTIIKHILLEDEGLINYWARNIKKVFPEKGMPELQL